MLSAPEQACIRDVLDAATLATALNRLVMSAGDTLEQWEASLFACLAPDTVRAVLLSGMITSMQEEVEVSEEEISCLRESAADIDAAALVASADASVVAAGFIPLFVRCLPDQFLSPMLAGIGVDMDAASADERLCLREWAADADWTALFGAVSADDIVGAGAFMSGLASCLPDQVLPLMLGEMGADLDALSADERACLREWAVDADWTALLSAISADNLVGAAAFMSDLATCLPDLFLSQVLTGAGVELGDLSTDESACLREWAADADWTALFRATSTDDPAVPPEFAAGLIACAPDLLLPSLSGEQAIPPAGVDDQANGQDETTAATIGEPVPGTLNFAGDADRFVFQADAGQLYQIDVALGTLADSVATLYDAGEAVLASNDDYEDTGASRIVWEAPSTGEYYVVVAGYGANTGSYTFTVTASDIVDDHANAISDATAVTLGEPAQGALDYGNDADVFVFQAVAGQLYQIDVALDTLADSVTTLYGTDEFLLAFSSDRADSATWRIIWEAPSTGEHYLEITGFGTNTGSYTVTVAVSDIVDDHANANALATVVTVGEPVPGALDYTDDADVFVFQAEAGEIYQIDVALGTLADSVATLYDADELPLASNDDHADSAASRITWGATSAGAYYVEVTSFDENTGSYTLTVTVSDVADDHANAIALATVVTVGESVPGALDYEGDADIFLFQAEAGELYQIDVALGTLADSVAALYDADELLLASNDDYEDSAASRIVWVAPSTGAYYLEVTGFGAITGSYTLTVAVSDIVDDHANANAEATAAMIGDPVPGTLEFSGDADRFVFQAEAGQRYQIDVALGTLPDSVLALLDADEILLASNDDFEDSAASRIVWEAPSTGKYYVVVTGFGTNTGSYALTVARG